MGSSESNQEVRGYPEVEVKMKLKFIARFDDKHGKGTEVEVDKIAFDPSYRGNFKVRVVGKWKRPKYLAITWFVNVPESLKDN